MEVEVRDLVVERAVVDLLEVVVDLLEVDVELEEATQEPETHRLSEAHTLCIELVDPQQVSPVFRHTPPQHSTSPSHAPFPQHVSSYFTQWPAGQAW